MLEWITSPDAWLVLITLSALEIILGIDNIIFLAILVSKLPVHLRDKGRILGLLFAMLTRILLLFSLFWVMKLTKPLFSIYFGDLTNLNGALFSFFYFAFFIGPISESTHFWGEISGRDLVLFFGGLFLIIKSIKELKESILHKEEENLNIKISSKLWVVVAEIAIIDIVFSLDSVITAVGIAQNIEIMVLAVILAVLVMLFASKPIAIFVDRYPSIKILALAFLVLIGVVLVCESIDLHIDKAYIYVAMFFALSVQILNIMAQKNAK
ncbi:MULTISPECIES: TerC family protein [unclassified Campylobacter]|uniref:TerC family protein n=1 Tax=unclassified Campylobacter TaxID=2593542 RepID=UPI0012382E8B|nr:MULTISPECIES: TerC family protein [unclassified Campylobacter]KAA6225111.1 TerC family protein [Campylobacter sp. LR196d]KAA6226125.1 TerC family protein [Campylobacter sp. LR185c]KAA6228072.1 TerC family protein [Campylobacter sp. LR286c]KAA6231325.1 TerC family protein [Campylobacter sp. LR264d]KAA6231537.1 TerC family protein [Campylobacter sp. LR291e]